MIKPVYRIWALWVVLATAGLELFAQGKEAKPEHPAASVAPKTSSPKPLPPRAGQSPNNQGPGGGQEKLGRPVYPLDRWAAMSPAQRDAATAKWTPERRANLEKRLAKWESMPEAQKERVRNLTPEQRQILTAHAQWMQTLPPERRQVIRRQIQTFEQMSPEARQAELGSPSFNRKFDAVEREHVQKVVSTMPKEE